jgi:hypothetical protein
MRLPRLLALTLVLLTLLVAAPAARASIQPPQRHSDQPTYIGWATIRDGSCDYTQNWRCFDTSYVDAWNWTGSAWQQDYRAVGQRVYAYPYVKGWTWTWTAGSGWRAVRSGNVAIG